MMNYKECASREEQAKKDLDFLKGSISETSQAISDLKVAKAMGLEEEEKSAWANLLIAGK